MGIGDNIYYVASFLTVHLVFYQVILATFFFSFLGEQSTSLRTGFNYHHQHNINLDRTGTSRPPVPQSQGLSAICLTTAKCLFDYPLVCLLWLLFRLIPQTNCTCYGIHIEFFFFFFWMVNFITLSLFSKWLLFRHSFSGCLWWLLKLVICDDNVI